MLYGQPLEKVEAWLKKEGNTTVYEKKNGIICKGMDLIKQSNSMRIYNLLKSDNSKTLCIVFRTGKISDSWVVWYIAEDQINMLKEFFGIYEKVDSENNLKRYVTFKD